MKSLSNEEQRTVTRETCLSIIESLEASLIEFEAIIDHERDKAEHEKRAAIRETIRNEEKRFLIWLKGFLIEFAEFTPAQKKLLENLKYDEKEIKSWLRSVVEGHKYRADLLFRYTRRPTQQELFNDTDYGVKKNYTTKGQGKSDPRAYHY